MLTRSLKTTAQGRANRGRRRPTQGTRKRLLRALVSQLFSGEDLSKRTVGLLVVVRLTGDPTVTEEPPADVAGVLYGTWDGGILTVETCDAVPDHPSKKIRWSPQVQDTRVFNSSESMETAEVRFPWLTRQPESVRTEEREDGA